MNYQEFACPECNSHPLKREVNYLRCETCGRKYEIRQSIPILFPEKGVSAVVDGQNVSLQDVRNVYDRVYNHDGLMGTDLDEMYNCVTKKTLLDFAKPLIGKRVLDLGTGIGSLWDFVPVGSLGYAIDPSYVGVVKALQRRSDLTVCASVGEHLPFPDSFFNVVVAADTIEHTFSPQQTLKEIRRVLKPSGTFCASFPTPNSLYKWGLNQFINPQFHPGNLGRLILLLLKRAFLFGKAAFQPIDRDLNDKEWVTIVETSGFNVLQVIEWPQSPQKPIVILVHAKT